MKDKETGYIRISQATFTRTGVFRYYNEDGSERFEFRPPDEVFKPATIDSMQGLPLFNEHPPVRVDMWNVKGLRPTGATANDLKKSGKNIVGSLNLWDGESINEAEQGKADLSMGYTTDIIEQAGIADGISYTHVQTNIIYNHVAQVEQGRAGNASFKLDGEPAIAKNNGDTMNDLLDLLGGLTEINDRADGKSPWVKVGKEKFILESKDDVKKAIAAFKTHTNQLLKDATKKAKKGDEDIDNKSLIAELEAERDAALAERDAAAIKLNTENKADSDKKAKAKFDAAVAEQVNLRTIANTLKVDIADDTSAMGIKTAIVVAHGNLDSKTLENKSDAYIDARFDIVQEELASRINTNAALNSNDTVTTINNDSDESICPDDARLSMIDSIATRSDTAKLRAKEEKAKLRLSV